MAKKKQAPENEADRGQASIPAFTTEDTQITEGVPQRSGSGGGVSGRAGRKTPISVSFWDVPRGCSDFGFVLGRAARKPPIPISFWDVPGGRRRFRFRFGTCREEDADLDFVSSNRNGIISRRGAENQGGQSFWLRR